MARTWKGQVPADGRLLASLNGWEVYARDKTTEVGRAMARAVRDKRRAAKYPHRKGRVCDPATRPFDEWKWKPFKVIYRARIAHKANFHLSWNSDEQRLIRSSEAQALSVVSADVYAWVLDVMQQHYPRVERKRRSVLPNPKRARVSK